MSQISSISSPSSSSGELQDHLSDHASPSSTGSWEAGFQTHGERFPFKEGCPVRRNSVMMGGCARARIIAVMALQLFVFDEQTDTTQDCWACPFGECKHISRDPKSLMQHVWSCKNYSSTRVYCHTCQGRSCFSIDCPRCLCGLSDESMADTRQDSTKSKVLGKIKNILSRRRAGSGSSSGSTDYSERPGTMSSRQGTPSAFTATFDPSNEPHVSRIGLTQGVTVHSTECATTVASSSELDSMPVVPELPDSGIAELSDTTLPVELEEQRGLGPAITDTQEEAVSTRISQSSQCWGSEAPEYRSLNGEILSNISPSSFCAKVTPQTYNNSSAAFQSSHQQGLHQVCEHPWAFDQCDMGDRLQNDLQCAPPNAQDGASLIDHADEINDNSLDFHDEMLFASGVCHQPDSSSMNWQMITTAPSPTSPEDYPVQDPAQSWQSDMPPSISTVSNLGSSPWLNYSQYSAFNDSNPGSSSMFSDSTTEVSPIIPPPPPDGTDFRCPLCSYKADGIPSNRKSYLQKHLATHNPSNKFTCPDCGKTCTRKDNLTTHQRNSCPKRPYLSHPSYPPSRRHAIKRKGDELPRNGRYRQAGN